MGREAPAGALVFAGAGAGRPLSNVAMLMLLRRMGRGDLTAYDFRSTFRGWTEATAFPREPSETALEHVNGDEAEAAHARGAVLAKRVRLMEAWAAYCAKPAKAPATLELIEHRREARA